MERENPEAFQRQIQAMHATPAMSMPIQGLPKNIVYKVEGNRLWVTEQAKFVKRTPSGATVIELMKDGVLADEDYLKETLVHYGFEIGDELKSLEEVKEERLLH